MHTQSNRWKVLTTDLVSHRLLLLECVSEGCEGRGKMSLNCFLFLGSSSGASQDSYGIALGFKGQEGREMDAGYKNK